MAVKIRLQRRGRTKNPFYHIVVADARAPRDGRFIEKIGTYNPMTKPATIELDRDLAYDWLMKGAQPTDTARAILKFKGVLYRKHLMRGVRKGALTQEEADAKYQQWIDDKDAKVAARVEAAAEERRQFHAKVAGKPKPVAKQGEEAAAPVAKGSAPEPQDTRSFAESVEQTTVESFSGEGDAPKKKSAEVPAPEARKDDLTKIEGIGPKIAETLQQAGIGSFADLAAADAEKLKTTLSEAGLAAHDPATWPQQSQMAAAGEWDKLKTWQDELQGGKEVAVQEEE